MGHEERFPPTRLSVSWVRAVPQEREKGGRCQVKGKLKGAPPPSQKLGGVARTAGLSRRDSSHLNPHGRGGDGVPYWARVGLLR